MDEVERSAESAPRDDHGRRDPRSPPLAREDPDRARRQSLPLYRIRSDLPRDPEAMRTAISSLELLAPTVGDALRMLRDEEGVVPLAGATDLYVSPQLRHAGVAAVRESLGLRPLRHIGMQGDTLVIGALATYTAIIRSRHVQRRLPMLVQASRRSGRADPESRNPQGGHPAGGDTLPVLAADAVVVLRSVEERRVRFSDFYTAAGQRRPDELGQRGRDRADPARHPVVPKSAPRPRLYPGGRPPCAPAPRVALGSGTDRDPAAAHRGGACVGRRHRRGGTSPSRRSTPSMICSTSAYRYRVASNLLRRFD